MSSGHTNMPNSLKDLNNISKVSSIQQLNSSVEGKAILIEKPMGEM